MTRTRPGIRAAPLALATALAIVFAVACGGDGGEAPATGPPPAATGAAQGAAATEPPDVDYTVWAGAVCAAAETFAQTLNSSDDGIDPSRLRFEQRKVRALRLGALEYDAARALADALDIESPGEASAAYTAALATLARVSAEATQAQLLEVQAATSNTQIDASNVRFTLAVAATEEEVSATALALPTQALTALGAVTACGRVQG
ncbi:MAG: hypothetical protein QF664_12030 [Dehalococcoidia bacterium]|nr:hypothetical protein [Dehalococcoidia bacterium]